ncbi:zinc finger protein 665-like [Sabethes cyaneus]|uniref:zinc finger protein 665-like n=1 Tax=Sabethes cyaneus TaxID=53552 RepID=UPI00237DC159|nr:zinc finger protein 665-like [Sabethes cyaneus]XP_053694880.1 zinc finger protein 665-like [Sabethes cyaneus]
MNSLEGSGNLNFPVKVEDGNIFQSEDADSAFTVTKIQKYEQIIDDDNEYEISTGAEEKEEDNPQKVPYGNEVGFAFIDPEVQIDEYDGMIDEPNEQIIRYTSNDTQCRICAMIFSNQKSLHAHIRNQHLAERCDFCQSVALTKKQEKIHKNSCLLRFTCEICGTMFKHLKAHNLRVHTAIERQYACTVCPKRFLRDDQLMMHMSTHTGRKPFQCDTCGKRFTTKHSLSTHQLLHASIPPFECDVCGKRTRYRHQMKLHAKTHISSNYHCDMCEKSFDVKRFFEAHKRCHRKRHGSFRCKRCGKLYLSATWLAKHQRSSEPCRPNLIDLGGSIKTEREPCSNSDEPSEEPEEPLDVGEVTRATAIGTKNDRNCIS